MSFDLGYLPVKRYEELSKILKDAGRMLGGWQKSVKGSYFPSINPVSYHISASGKRIPVSCLKDRLVALAIKQALLSYLEPSFIYDTYAGVPSRGFHRAVKRVMDFQRRVALPQYPCSGWILKADIKDFYPSIRHDVLLAQAERRFQDNELAELLFRFLGV